MRINEKRVSDTSSFKWERELHWFAKVKGSETKLLHWFTKVEECETKLHLTSTILPNQSW